MKIVKLTILIAFLALEAGLFVSGLYLVDLYAKKAKTSHNELLAWQQKGDNLRRLQESYRQEEEAISVINSALPGGGQAIAFFKELEQMAAADTVALDLQMPSLPVRDDNQSIETFLLNLKVKGTYSQVNNYLKKIEQHRQLIIVRQITLRMPEGLSGEVIANVAIKTYFSLNT